MSNDMIDGYPGTESGTNLLDRSGESSIYGQLTTYVCATTIAPKTVKQK